MKKIDPKFVAIAAVDWSMCATAGMVNGAAYALICKGIDVAGLPKIIKPVALFGVMSFGVWQSLKFFDISKEIVDFGEKVINCVKESFNKDIACCGDCDHCVENEDKEKNTIKGQIGFRI